jgi:hypothetical protein
LLNPEWYLDSVPLESRIQAKIAYSVAAEMGREAKVIWGNTSYMSLPGRVYVTGGTVAAGLTGVRDLSDAGATDTAVDARPQGTGERVLKGGLGTVQVVFTALPIAGMATKFLGLESKAASTALRAEASAAARTAEGAPLGKVAVEELASNSGRLRDPKSLADFNLAEQLDMRIKHQSLISRLRYSDVEMPPGSMSAQLMGELTVATEQEVALIRIGNQRLLRLGGADSAFVGDADRLIAHTHPSGVLRFSTGPESDMSVFTDILTKQRSSVLVAPDGTAVRLPIVRP